jgi:NADH:ubiquinone oxidoreductase subunit 4 (subunit M)
MDFIQNNILNLVIFLPLLGALIIFWLPEDEKPLIRRLAFVWSLLPLDGPGREVAISIANYDLPPVQAAGGT